LLLAPSCNSLVSVTYKLPPRKSFATRTKMIGEGEGCYVFLGPAVSVQLAPSLAATRLDISYNLRFALLALANSEVSG